MFSAIRMGPAVSGRRLCDIDRVFSRVTKSRIKRLGSRGRRKYTDYIEIEKAKLSVYFRRAKTSQLLDT